MNEGNVVVRACRVPGTVLGAGDAAMSKVVKIPVSPAHGLRGSDRERRKSAGEYPGQAVLSARGGTKTG